MKKISDELRAIADITLMDTWLPCSGEGSDSCITKEEHRPLTRKEKELGWCRRPFNYYVADNMCLSCRVYWHVSVASNDAHRLECHHEAGHDLPKSKVSA